MSLNNISAAELTQFVDYCWSFYGSDGLYPVPGLTRQFLSLICEKYSRSSNYMGGDSIDRENVRSLIGLC